MDDDPESVPKGRLALICPTCGLDLLVAPDSPTDMICIGEHQFDLGTLLINQSVKAACHLDIAKRLLEQQIQLVRAISAQMWVKHPDEAAKLDARMDLVQEKVDILAEIINQGPPLQEGDISGP